MEKNPKRTPIVIDYDSLNKFLMGTLTLIRNKEIQLDEAEKIAQISDKIVKNNLTAIMDKRRRNDKSPLEFFDPIDKQVLIG